MGRMGINVIPKVYKGAGLIPSRCEVASTCSVQQGAWSHRDGAGARLLECVQVEPGAWMEWRAAVDRAEEGRGVSA